jgi:hypothetical protein
MYTCRDPRRRLYRATRSPTLFPQGASWQRGGPGRGSDKDMKVAVMAWMVSLASAVSEVTLSNIALPKDSAGRQLLTGEVDV